MRSIDERLLARRRVTDSGCWEWTGSSVPSKGGARYGQMKIGGRAGRYEYVHRVAHRLWIGPIAEGLTIDHLCRNTLCFNPGHLEAVTQRENNLRGVTPWSENAKKTHCAHGHLFNEANTWVRIRGNRTSRACRRCNAENQARLKARRRAVLA